LLLFICNINILKAWIVHINKEGCKLVLIHPSYTMLLVWNLEFGFEYIATQISQFKELHFYLDFPSMNDLSHWSGQRAHVGIPFFDASSQQALIYTMFQKWIRHKLFILKIHPTTRQAHKISLHVLSLLPSLI
jgi:hypothetical protein